MLFSRRNRKNFLPDRSPARQRANRRESPLRQREIQLLERRRKSYEPYASGMLRSERQRRHQSYVSGASEMVRGGQRGRRKVYETYAPREGQRRRQSYVPGASEMARGAQRRRQQQRNVSVRTKVKAKREIRNR